MEFNDISMSISTSWIHRTKECVDLNSVIDERVSDDECCGDFLCTIITITFSKLLQFGK